MACGERREVLFPFNNERSPYVYPRCDDNSSIARLSAHRFFVQRRVRFSEPDFLLMEVSREEKETVVIDAEAATFFCYAPFSKNQLLLAAFERENDRRPLFERDVRRGFGERSAFDFHDIQLADVGGQCCQPLALPRKAPLDVQARNRTVRRTTEMEIGFEWKSKAPR